MVKIVTEHGEYTGRTVSGIVHRVYGRKAEYVIAFCSPEIGKILKRVRLPSGRMGSAVLATVERVER